MRVPRFEPFAASRYSAAEPLDGVTAPPYDVLVGGRRRGIAASTTRTTSSPSTCPSIATVRSATTLAGRRLRRVDRRRRAGRRTIARRSPCTACTSPTKPAAHRDDRRGRSAGWRSSTKAPSGVLPHERTTPKAKTDRLDLTSATRCNLSPDLGPVADRRAHVTARVARRTRRSVHGRERRRPHRRTRHRSRSASPPSRPRSRPTPC